MNTPEENIIALINARLPRIADKITSLLRYSIRMKARSTQENELAIGITKIGGRPDMPPGIAWPTWDDQPLAFIAQINLSETASYDREHMLPTTGMLYFFYDEQFDYPPKPECWRVLYDSSEHSHLHRVDFPPDLENRFTSCAIDFSIEITLPPFESPYIEQLGLSYNTAYSPTATPEGRKEAEAYQGLLNHLDTQYDRRMIHRVLGHPDPIQGDMMLECQMFTHGLTWKDYQQNDPRITELQRDSLQWRLLLQIDSDNEAAMMWGDVGRIYYLIPEEALIAQKFDNTWLIFQCY